MTVVLGLYGFFPLLCSWDTHHPIQVWYHGRLQLHKGIDSFDYAQNFHRLIQTLLQTFIVTCLYSLCLLQAIVGIVHQYVRLVRLLHTHRELLLQGYYCYMWDTLMCERKIGSGLMALFMVLIWPSILTGWHWGRNVAKQCTASAWSQWDCSRASVLSTGSTQCELVHRNVTRFGLFAV